VSTVSETSRHAVGHDGHVWPTMEQELLLTAACCRDARARQAFAAWRQTVDVEQEFDWQMVRLLPAVYANLQALGETDPLMARLKGVYRRSWVETHRLLQRGESVVAALSQAGIPVMMLKGAAMLLAYYPSHAQRPMGDLDLAVPIAHAPRAIAALRALGWQPTSGESADHYRWFHAMQFFHPDGGELDLHWHVMVETTAGEGDTLLWDAAESVEFSGQSVQLLAPTDLLFHTVLHGVRWNDATPIRWIIDARQILERRSADIDWTRLLDLSARLAVSHRMALGLAYLSEHHDAAIPPVVLTTLRGGSSSWRERLEASVILTDLADRPKHFLQYYYTMLADFSRVADPRLNALAFAWQFPHYLRYRLKLGGRRELIGLVARGLFKRLGGGTMATRTADAQGAA